MHKADLPKVAKGKCFRFRLAQRVYTAKEIYDGPQGIEITLEYRISIGIKTLDRWRKNYRTIKSLSSLAVDDVVSNIVSGDNYVVEEICQDVVWVSHTRLMTSENCHDWHPAKQKAEKPGPNETAQ